MGVVGEHAGTDALTAALRPLAFTLESAICHMASGASGSIVDFAVASTATTRCLGAGSVGGVPTKPRGVHGVAAVFGTERSEKNSHRAHCFAPVQLLTKMPSRTASPRPCCRVADHTSCPEVSFTQFRALDHDAFAVWRYQKEKQPVRWS